MTPQHDSLEEESSLLMSSDTYQVAQSVKGRVSFGLQTPGPRLTTVWFSTAMPSPNSLLQNHSDAVLIEVLALSLLCSPASFVKTTTSHWSSSDSSPPSDKLVMVFLGISLTLPSAASHLVL